VLQALANTLSTENLKPVDRERDQEDKLRDLKARVEKITESTSEMMKSSQAQTDHLKNLVEPAFLELASSSKLRRLSSRKNRSE